MAATRTPARTREPANPADTGSAAASLEALEAELAAEKVAADETDRERLRCEEELRELERLGTYSVEAVQAVKARRLDAARASTAHREAVDRIERELHVRTDLPAILGRRALAPPAELEDGLVVARRAFAAAQQVVATQNVERSQQLLRAPQTSAVVLERLDAAKAGAAREVERAAAVVHALEEALAAARDRWPALQAAFEADLSRALEQQAEEARLIRDYLEEKAPAIAQMLGRLVEIERFHASLRTRARILGREGEVPESANHELRGRLRPLWDTDGVQLPGRIDSDPIWPRRGL